MKRIAKIIYLLLAATLLFSGYSDKSSKSKDAGIEDEPRYTVDENTPAWKLDPKEETTLTWYVNAEWWNTDYGNDTITKKLKEDLNLNIKFIKGDDTKLNTFFANGDLPDIITIFGMNNQTAEDAASWALPLNKLAEKYDPYFFKVASEETLNWYKLEDGNTYGYPSYSNTTADYESGFIPGNEAFIIRQDVYEAIGKPSMKTPEEFLAAMELIKQKFPKLVPFGFRGFVNADPALGTTLQNMLGVPIATDDYKWYDRNLDEDYLTWLKTFNEAYRRGYISDDNFSDDNPIFEEKVAKGEYATILTGGVAQLYTYLTKNMEADPNRKYIAIDGPASTVGREPTLSQSGISGWSVTYITKECKDPQKAIQIFTYLLSDEGQYLTTFGVEGETFKFNENGKAVLLPEVQKLQNENPEEFKTKYRLGEFWFFGHDRFKAEHGENPPLEAVDQIKAWGTPYLKPQFLIENIDPDQGTAEARRLVNINAQWKTTLASLIRAKNENEFEKILNEYKKYLDENNFDAIVKIRNEKMQENREKLGLK